MDSKCVSAPEWVATEAGATRAMESISAASVAGYDSEFDGVRIGEESCVGKARVDVFSIATPTGRLNALGYFEPQSWVFEGTLITHEPVRRYLEDSSAKKVAHNLSVDSHAARNAGVRLRGAQDTLNLARWVYPERANLARGNYDLDSLCKWRVGFGKTEDFDDFLGYYVDEPYEDVVEAKWCLECMDFCKKKKPPHDQKVLASKYVTRTKKVRRFVDLATIRPGKENEHLFERYLVYAATDAELALIIWQMMQIDGQKERPYPYGQL